MLALKKTMYSRWTLSESHIIDKLENIQQRSDTDPEIHLALQLIHVVFAKASSEMLSVDDGCQEAIIK